MSDTFSKVQMRAEAAFLRERASLLLEFEKIGLDQDRTPQYLFISFPKALELDGCKGGMVSTDQWAGQVKHIERFVSAARDHVSAKLKDFKRHLADQQERQTGALNQLGKRVDKQQEQLRVLQGQIGELIGA